jgi:quercetin dioxygenase-like cupin family protein
VKIAFQILAIYRLIYRRALQRINTGIHGEAKAECLNNTFLNFTITDNKNFTMDIVLQKSTRINLAEFVEYSSGSIVSKTLLKGNSGNLTLFSFDAGQGLSEHSAPFDASILMLDGEGEITIGGSPHLLKAGEFIIMPANIPHAVKAMNAFKMLLVMIRNQPE